MRKREETWFPEELGSMQVNRRSLLLDHTPELLWSRLCLGFLGFCGKWGRWCAGMWGQAVVGIVVPSEKFQQGVSVANWCLGCLKSTAGYHSLSPSSCLRFNFWYSLWSASPRDGVCPSLWPLAGVGICYPHLCSTPWVRLCTASAALESRN